MFNRKPKPTTGEDVADLRTKLATAEQEVVTTRKTLQDALLRAHDGEAEPADVATARKALDHATSVRSDLQLLLIAAENRHAEAEAKAAASQNSAADKAKAKEVARLLKVRREHAVNVGAAARTLCDSMRQLIQDTDALIAATGAPVADLHDRHIGKGLALSLENYLAKLDAPWLTKAPTRPRHEYPDFLQIVDELNDVIQHGRA